MIDRGRHEIIGVNVNAVDYEAAVDQVRQAAEKHQSLTVSAAAVHGITTGALDRFHRYRLNHFDLVVPDGQPVRWALNLMHRTKLSDRVSGPVLMWHVCVMAAERGLPVFLFGSGQHVVDALSERLKEALPKLKIAGTLPSLYRQTSPEEQLEIVRKIRESGAAITLVGLGCPRQEVWIYENRKYLDMPLLGVGSGFDIHAGLLKDAPQVMQDYGVQWLFRLCQEPGRLWKRYVFLNPTYVFLFVMQLLKLPYTRSEGAEPPVEEMRYG